MLSDLMMGGAKQLHAVKGVNFEVTDRRAYLLESDKRASKQNLPISDLLRRLRII
jgi:hypothetical protein